MRGRFLRRRFSASAPKLTIRTHIPWPLRIIAAMAALTAAAAFGAWWAGTGPSWARGDSRDKGRVEIEAVRAENQRLREERDRPLAATAPVDSRGVMERSTVKEMGEQIARLEADNTKLKEDIAFFEAATTEQRAPALASGGIAIRRFQITQDRAAHTARYRLLLTQDSKAKRDFAGELQLVVTIAQRGNTANITLPGSPAPAPAANIAADSVSVEGGAAQFQVAFRSYKRLEGSLRIPADASLKAVHAKVLERGVVRAQQTVTLG